MKSDLTLKILSAFDKIPTLKNEKVRLRIF